MKQLIAVTITLMMSAAANAALITNGSLTGPTGQNTLPSGWTALSYTPDTNDISNAENNSQTYNVPAVESTDGGTWVGVGSNATATEAIGQNVAGLTVGTEYTLSWENANFGYGNTYQSPNAFEVFVNGSSIGAGSQIGLGSLWADESISFIATMSNFLLEFRLVNKYYSYLQIDGISLDAVEVPEISEVPVPAAAFLFAPALLGFMGLRRKAKQA